MISNLSVENRAGKPIKHHGRRLILFSRSLTVTLPGSKARLIWNKPASVLVVNPDGGEQLIPIQDRTRRIVIIILACGLAGSLIIGMFARRRS
jgi:hypothetical protein